MPLVLGLMKDQGFVLEGQTFLVDHIDHGTFTLLHRETGATFEIGEDHSTEIYEDVYVSAGMHKSSNLASVAIDAPKEIRISRIPTGGSLYA